MDPMSLLGGIGGGIFSIMGANKAAEESSRIQALNTMVNMFDYQLRERERNDRIQQAKLNREDTHLGARDADGNRTHFVEGVGWLTDLSPIAQAIRDAQNKEQEYTLNQDIPAKRAKMFENLGQERLDRQQADALMHELKTVQREDPSAWENRLYAAATRGIADAFGAQTNIAMRTALRTGASNTGEILKAFAAQQAAMERQASEDAALKAPQMAEAQYNDRRNNLLQQYNLFDQKARQMPDVTYQPQNTSGQTNSILSQFIGEAGVSGRDLASAFGQKGGTIDYFQPDYGQANALASTGQVIGSIGRSAGGMIGGGGRGGSNAYVDQRLRAGG
jgi:hypothetical protein